MVVGLAGWLNRKKIDRKLYFITVVLFKKITILALHKSRATK